MKFSQYVNHFPQIVVDGIKLRKLKTPDAKCLLDYYSNPEVYRYLDWNGPSNINDAKKIISIWNKGYKNGIIIRFGIEDIEEKVIIGTIFLSDFNGNRADIGYELNKKYWNKGIMKTAINEILKMSFDVLKLRRIQATVDENNARSIKLLEKCGFKYEGKLKNYETNHVTNTVKDMFMYSIIK